MRLDNAQSIKEVIEEWRKSIGSRDKWNESRAMEVFRHCLPKHINSKIENVRIQNGVLFVRFISSDDTSTAALKQEMFYKRRFYVTNINKAIGSVVVSDIVFN